jgi:oligoribonuclease (3'-5' exoribonuclease)
MKKPTKKAVKASKIDLSDYVFVDIETTGVNLDKGEILEIAMYHAPSGKRISLLVKENEAGHDLNAWEPEAAKLHFASGLAHDLLYGETGTHDLECAENQIHFWLDSVGFNSSRKPMMAGKSIQFDREWIKEKIPAVADRFNYRMMDVSSVRRALRLVGIETAHTQSSTLHRALADAIDAKDELEALLNAARGA